MEFIYWASWFGHMPYNAHKRTTHDKRKDYVECDVDTKTLLPCFMKAK